MKKLFVVGAFLLGSAGMLMSQCTTFSGGPYIDFNNAGGAPCLEEPVRIVTAFEAWASESYLMSGIEAGVTYTFDICTGQTSPPPWEATFTIIRPDGSVLAFGTDGVTGAGPCSITFTADVSGEYQMGISQVGFCPGGPFTGTDNGNPRISYVSGPISSCLPPVITCEAGNLVDNLPVSICPEENTSVDVTGEIIPNSPTIGGQGVLFQPQAGASGGLSGEFILSGVSMPYTFNNDLNGVLSSNGFPPMVGLWNVRPAVYADQANTFASICDTTFRSKPVTFIPTGGPGCAAFACEAGAVTAADQQVCPGEDWNLTVSGEILPNPGEFLWFFFAQDTVANDDYVYSFGNDPTFYNYVGDLNADLIAATLDPLAPGAYDVIGAVYDLSGDSICSVSAGSFEIVVYGANDSACSGCQSPTNLDVVEIGFGGTNPRVNATWTNPEGTAFCEVRGGRISTASYNAGEPEFANLANTQVINQTDGSTVNFNIALYNNPNIPFTIGARYGYEVRCDCGDGSGLSDWANITPEATFVVPAPPPGIFVNQDFQEGVSKASIAAVKSVEVNAIPNIVKNAITPSTEKAKRPVVSNAKAAVSSNMTLFPNPTSNELNISINSASAQNMDVRIFDMTGRSIMVTQFNTAAGMNMMNIDVTELVSGLYFIEVGTGDNAERRPFVKK